MNQEKVIESLLTYLQKTENFLSEEIPLILIEILKYEKISSIFCILTSTFIICMGILLFFYSFKNPCFDKYEHRHIGSILGMWMSAIFVFLPLSSLYISIDKLICINVTPKYFLIKMLLSMHK